MGHPSGRHHQRQPQPQGQPPWASYPPTGQSGYQPPVHKAPKPSRPSPSRRRRHRKRNTILLMVAVILLIAAISDALHGGAGGSPKLAAAASSPAPAPHPSARANSSSSKSKISAAETACDKKGLASGDIYLRMVQPGEAPVAQQLGGEWQWDYTSSKCLTSVQWAIATAPMSTGDCTQVGYVADNPGYDPNATVAAPLSDVVAQAGPACSHAAAPSTPAETTPAASPAPSASATQAGCYPISDEGTCYEPGEYCRDDDHGVSGVAGDGESIICEDNDGWRWEPA